MSQPLDLVALKHIVHTLSETQRAALRGYLLTVFDVRGRDVRVNLRPEERERPRP